MLRGLVESCLYNFLGYGNLNGNTWFLGVEEGGAEIWRFQKKTLEESLALRRDFNLLWIFDMYGRTCMAYHWRILKDQQPGVLWLLFCCSFQGMTPDSESIRRYVFEDKMLVS